MTAVKTQQKQEKAEAVEAKPASKLSEKLQGKKWKKVKLKGKVISDEFAGYEGLIGLEVLENYDMAMVGEQKPKQTRKQARMERKKNAKKRKQTEREQQASSSVGIVQEADDDTDVEESANGSASEADEPESLEEDEPVLKRKKKTTKANATDHEDKKKAKILEKRKKRKELRKQIKTEKKKKATEEDAEYPPERFALLRPPPASDEKAVTAEEEQAPELVNANALHMDDLEGWNGLGVPQPILRALAEKGFKSPTEIQALTLPAAIMGKKDILGAAETGSGKTLAFGIPILAGIMELKAKNARTGIRKAVRVKGQQADETAAEPATEAEERELTPPPEELEMPSDSENSVTEESSDDEVEHAAGKRNGALYALILTPTRELAVQIRDHLEAAAKYLDIHVAVIFGGLSMAKQERVLKRCPEIVVATPGRFWELYQQETPHLSQIDDISFLVIDEADRMVEKDHFEELHTLLKVLNADERKKQSRQNFVFSATLTLVHDLPEHLQKRNMGKRQRLYKQTPGMKIQSIIEELGISQPKVVDITRTQQTAQNLTECRLICPLEHKDYYLYYFLQRHPGRTIVFCNSIDCVKRLATLFGLLQLPALPLHANMIQKQRLKNLERFRDNERGLLIATDVAARGLDIPNVEHVIHYQVPRTSENYVHRSGRTARANKRGITVMLMEPGEVQSYVKLYRTLEMSKDLPLFPVAERYLAAVKERVNLAREVDIEELKLRRTQTEQGWMKKHAEDMDLIIDGYNNESGSEQDEDPYIIERRRNRVRLTNVRTDLHSLLDKPIFPKGYSFKYPTSTGKLQLPDIVGNKAEQADDSGSAVNVMKQAIEDLKLAKKMRNKKRK